MPSRIHGARLEVKQSRYLMHASYENSNKVVNNTYLVGLTIPGIFLALELVFLLLLKCVCVLATHVTRKSVNSLHLETNQ